MILTCFYNGAFAWAELAPADRLLPDPHDGCTYTLEARK